MGNLCCPLANDERLLPKDTSKPISGACKPTSGADNAAVQLQELKTASVALAKSKKETEERSALFSDKAARAPPPAAAAAAAAAPEASSAKGNNPPHSMDSMESLQAKVERKQQQAWEKALNDERADEATSRASSTTVGQRDSIIAPQLKTPLDHALWAAFTLADSDGSGTLSKLEFTLALQAVGLVTGEQEARHEWFAVDADASGSVEWAEFRALGERRQALISLPERLQAQPARVERAAATIQRIHRSQRQLPLRAGGGDAGASGRPAKDAAAATAGSGGPPRGESGAGGAGSAGGLKQVPDAIERAWLDELNAELRIERQRRAAAAEAAANGAPTAAKGRTARLPPPSNLRTSREHALWAAFALADTDGSGALSKVEFTLALQAVGLAMDARAAYVEWKRAEKDGSGAIEWTEFKALGTERTDKLKELPDMMRKQPKACERAALVIQRSWSRRLMQGADGTVRQGHQTRRV